MVENHRKIGFIRKTIKTVETHQKIGFFKNPNLWWFSTIILDYMNIRFFGGFPPKSMVDIHHVRPNHVNTLIRKAPLWGTGDVKSTVFLPNKLGLKPQTAIETAFFELLSCFYAFQYRLNPQK